jgi:hypothetical protein
MRAGAGHRGKLLHQAGAMSLMAMIDARLMP